MDLARTPPGVACSFVLQMLELQFRLVFDLPINCILLDKPTSMVLGLDVGPV